MAITAIVRFVIQKINGLPPATPGAGNTRYARASLQVGGDTVWTSRSRPIADAGGTFDIVPNESGRWDWMRGLDDATPVTLRVEIREDRGDVVGPAPLTFQGTISGPWFKIPSGTVKTLGGGPTFDVLVNTQSFNFTDVASIARARRARGVSGVLAVSKGFLLEITAIDGLYQPDPAAVPPAKGSKSVAGYLSRDDLGRIFSNRKPDGSWARDTQFIDVKLKITAFGGATFPGGAKVHWFVVDEDDPTNDSPDFHRDWGVYIDANDYDPAGAPTGAKRGDNALAYSPGNADEDLLLGAGAKGNNRWATGPDGEAPSPNSRSDATSPITIVDATKATSSVRIHCPNVLGTNFSLSVGMDGVPPTQVFSDAVTGTMTMWSRIDVEVVSMAGARSLAGALSAIPKSFVPMCVQMDCQTERIVSGPGKDLEWLAPPDGTGLEDKTTSWFSQPTVFSNRGKPGWFFMGGARFAEKPVPPGAASAPVYRDKKYKFGKIMIRAWHGFDQEFEYIEVPGVLRKAEGGLAIFKWKDGAADRKASFPVALQLVAGGNTRFVLAGNDVTPLFTGSDADGGTAHSQKTQIDFFPTQQRADTAVALAAGGFGIPLETAPNAAEVAVFPPGVASVTAGISPTVKAGGHDYFAGRTVIFTQVFDPAGFAKEVASTVIHEFMHAHGMPHKCGYWDWRTPRQPDGKTCCMNYFNTWLIDRSSLAGTSKLIAGFENRMSDDVCGRHLMEVRRVHLERNKGLKW